jgi:aspartyl-tRNA(Asn)/glutamyl-tRNA(Gln) amidotransferase subunit C
MITRDDVRHIARLARLRFTDAEEVQMAEELGRILDYVDLLAAIDTDGVAPMRHGGAVEPVVRPDAEATRIDRSEALRPSADADGIYVRVPKVIDG